MDASTQSPAPAPAPRPTVAWAPLGALFGVVCAAAIWLWAPIGVSTTYPRLVGALLRPLSAGYVAEHPMLVQIGSVVTPESVLVVGLLLGGFVTSRLWPRRAEVEPVHRAGEGPTRRALHAFLGGFLILFGARLAGGCTSGHILSGIIQLSLSGFLFAFGVFGAGIVTARLLARRGRS